jgi:hypothetical protein
VVKRIVCVGGWVVDLIDYVSWDGVEDVGVAFLYQFSSAVGESLYRDFVSESSCLPVVEEKSSVGRKSK